MQCSVGYFDFFGIIAAACNFCYCHRRCCQCSNKNYYLLLLPLLLLMCHVFNRIEALAVLKMMTCRVALRWTSFWFLNFVMATQQLIDSSNIIEELLQHTTDGDRIDPESCRCSDCPAAATHPNLLKSLKDVCPEGQELCCKVLHEEMQSRLHENSVVDEPNRILGDKDREIISTAMDESILEDPLTDGQDQLECNEVNEKVEPEIYRRDSKYLDIHRQTDPSDGNWKTVVNVSNTSDANETPILSRQKRDDNSSISPTDGKKEVELMLGKHENNWKKFHNFTVDKDNVTFIIHELLEICSNQRHSKGNFTSRTSYCCHYRRISFYDVDELSDDLINNLSEQQFDSLMNDIVLSVRASEKNDYGGGNGTNFTAVAQTNAGDLERTVSNMCLLVNFSCENLCLSDSIDIFEDYTDGDLELVIEPSYKYRPITILERRNNDEDLPSNSFQYLVSPKKGLGFTAFYWSYVGAFLYAFSYLTSFFVSDYSLPGLVIKILVIQYFPDIIDYPIFQVNDILWTYLYNKI